MSKKVTLVLTGSLDGIYPKREMCLIDAPASNDQTRSFLIQNLS